MTAITTPNAILPAAAAARPSTAPQPAPRAPSALRALEYSNSAAPANDPTNPPSTDPTTGTGTPMTAPTRAHECAPAGPARAPVAPGEAEPYPRLEDLAQHGESSGQPDDAGAD